MFNVCKRITIFIVLDNTAVKFCIFCIKMFHEVLRHLNKDAVPANNPAGKTTFKGNDKYTWYKCWLFSCSVIRQQEESLLNHVPKVSLFIRALVHHGPFALRARVLHIISCFLCLVLRALVSHGSYALRSLTCTAIH